jgi:hypothetical protein
MSLAGQFALTRTCDDARLRPSPVPDGLRLGRGHELFCLGETKPEVGQTGLLIAFQACDLHLRRLPGAKLRYQLDPPHQFYHKLTLVP